MIQDERVATRQDRALWSYLIEIKEMTERSLSEQGAIMKLLKDFDDIKNKTERCLAEQTHIARQLRDIRLCLLVIIGSSAAAAVFFAVSRLFP